MRFNSSALVFDFTTYTRDFVLTYSSPTELGKVTSVAKQQDTVAQSKGCENVV
jgi:hypothetical protein